MSKILKGLALLVGCFLTGSITAQPATAALASDKITVAVYPIKITGADKALEPVLTSLYITKLSESTKLKVVEEAMMDEVLKRLNFANSDMCDNSQCQLQVGKLTPASKLIVPTVSKLGDKYILNARVIDIQHGDIDFSAETKLVCKEDELDILVENASFDLREKFGEKVVRPRQAGQAQPSPVFAPSQPAPGAAPEGQNLLGIAAADDLTASQKRNYVGGVRVKSISPDSPCKNVIAEGNIIVFINPQGAVPMPPGRGSKYNIQNLNDFSRLVSSIQPGASVGLGIYAGKSTFEMLHSVNCAMPSQPQTNYAPQQPPPPSAPQKAPAPGPQKRAASPH